MSEFWLGFTIGVLSVFALIGIIYLLVMIWNSEGGDF